MTTSDALELKLLLEELGRQRFVNHEMRMDRDQRPDMLGFVRSWGGGTADVVILFDEGQACAWRTAPGSHMDALAPDLVSWWYHQSPVWTIRAVLALPPPGHPGEPRQLMPLPAGCAVPDDRRAPERVRMRSS